MAFVYVTFPDKKEADDICGMLLEKRLIACANLFPISSAYRWKEKVEKSEETAALLKTQEKHLRAIEQAIIERHSHDVPCICLLRSDDSDAFRSWVERET